MFPEATHSAWPRRCHRAWSRRRRRPGRLQHAWIREPRQWGQRGNGSYRRSIPLTASKTATLSIAALRVITVGEEPAMSAARSIVRVQSVTSSACAGLAARVTATSIRQVPNTFFIRPPFRGFHKSPASPPARPGFLTPVRSQTPALGSIACRLNAPSVLTEFFDVSEYLMGHRRQSPGAQAAAGRP